MSSRSFWVSRLHLIKKVKWTKIHSFSLEKWWNFLNFATILYHYKFVNCTLIDNLTIKSLSLDFILFILSKIYWIYLRFIAYYYEIYINSKCMLCWSRLMYLSSHMVIFVIRAAKTYLTKFPNKIKMSWY